MNNHNLFLQQTISFSLMSLSDDLDELEVYGKEEQSGVKLTSYTFEVSLLYLTYMCQLCESKLFSLRELLPAYVSVV